MRRSRSSPLHANRQGCELSAEGAAIPARKMPVFVSRSMACARPCATVPTIRADRHTPKDILDGTVRTLQSSAAAAQSPQAGIARSISGTQFTQSWGAIHPSVSVYFTQSCRIRYTMRQRSSTEWTLIVSERSAMARGAPDQVSPRSESFRQLESLAPARDRKTSRLTSTTAASRPD